MRLLIRLFICLLLFSLSAHSQDSVINVSNFEGYIDISPNLKVWEPGNIKYRIKDIQVSNFHLRKKSISKKDYYQREWYLLQLFYNGDEEEKTVFFYPGKMVNARIYFYDSLKGSWSLIRDREAFSPMALSSKIGLAPMVLKKGQVLTFVIQPELYYYNWQQWKPVITDHNAVNDLILHEFIQPNYTYSILTILIAGMMFMLFSYSILKFYLNRRSEYLYNSLFGLALLIFFAAVFVNNYYYQTWWHKYSAFFQKWLQILGFVFELIFIIRFLDLRTTRHKLFRFIRIVVIGLMAYCCILPFISFSDILYSYNLLFFDVITFILIGIGLYLSVELYLWNRQLSRYVSYGLFSLLFFTALIILQKTILQDKQYLVQRVGGWMVLYHAGILANLFSFRLGLGQKERKEELKNLDDIEKLKLENEKKELEKVLGIASSRIDERNRIAKEIHDDIGSGLTSIRLLSEIALVKKENKDELNKISSNANELVNNLNEIIWSINSKNDTIPNLLAYIRSHIVDYVEPHNLKLSVVIPSNVPNYEISGEKRRNIFMVIKECFTNIVKHANATAVNFTVQVRDQLIFTIKDNGKGFNEKDILPFKNGIRNMRERIELIGGEMDIWGKNGTTITIKIPLNGNGSL